MRKRLILITVIVAAVAAVPFLYAGPGHGRGHGRGHERGQGMHGMAFLGHLAHAKSELDLSDAQMDQLKSNLLVAASKALNVLTPEQRTKLALHLAEHGKRWENRGH